MKLTTHDSIVRKLKTRRIDIKPQTKNTINELKRQGKKSAKMQRFTAIAQETLRQAEKAKDESRSGKPNNGRFRLIKKLLGALGVAAVAATSVLVYSKLRKQKEEGFETQTINKMNERIRNIQKNIDKVKKETEDAVREAKRERAKYAADLAGDGFDDLPL